MSYIGNEPIVSATRTITETTATAGQTVFVANGGYTVGFIDVFVNGAQLQTSDFTATNGSSITLNSGASIGDDIRLVAWGTFSAANTYTAANIDSKIGAAQFAFKNRIINGDMRIDQRNAGASVTPTNGQYTLDRWAAYQSVASKFSVQQSTTVPSGFTNSLKVTSLSAYSITSSDYYLIAQNIEGFNSADLAWGTAGAKGITLSFRVYSSLTGTFGGAVANSSNARSYPFTYSISSANTWTTVSVTIPGDTSGTWETGNGIGIKVYLGLGVGSTYSGTAGAWAGANYLSATGATSVVGTSGATFYLTGVQLEVGSSATPFDTRAYGTELALCQRYCQYYGTGSGGFGSFGYGRQTSTTVSRIFVSIPPMRATPTISFGGSYVIDIPNGTLTLSSINTSYLSPSGGFFDINTSSGGTVGGSAAIQLTSGTGYSLLSAEL